MSEKRSIELENKNYPMISGELIQEKLDQFKH